MVGSEYSDGDFKWFGPADHAEVIAQINSLNPMPFVFAAMPHSTIGVETWKDKKPDKGDGGFL